MFDNYFDDVDTLLESLENDFDMIGESIDLEEGYDGVDSLLESIIYDDFDDDYDMFGEEAETGVEMTCEMLSEEIELFSEGKKTLVFDQTVCEESVKKAIEKKKDRMAKKGYSLVTALNKNVKAELARVKNPEGKFKKSFSDVKAKKVSGAIVFLYYCDNKLCKGTIMFYKNNEDGSASFRHVGVKVGSKQKSE